MKKVYYLLTSIIILLSVVGCSGRSEATWQEQYELGVRYLSEGNYEEAIIAFTAVIEIDPMQASAYVGRGQAYVFSAETEDTLTAAQADFEMAIGLDETLPDAWLGLADVYIRRGDYDKALEVLKEGLEKTSGDQSIADKITEVESGNILDSSGKTRRMSHYNESGVLEWYHEYTYNALGKQDSVTHRDSAGNQLGHIDLAYNENGDHLVSYGYNTVVGILFRNEHEYNVNGQEIKRTTYHENGRIRFYDIFQYDSNGNQIRDDTYRPDGTLDGYSVREYNSDGNTTKDSGYNADGSLSSFYTIEYNGKQRTRVNYYNSEGELTQYQIYHYNEQGKLTGSDTYDGTGNLMFSTSNKS